MGNTVAHSFIRSNFPTKRKAHVLDREFEEVDETFSPKRRKVMSTTKYIYKTLFEEGQGSDVKIVALNRAWNLHRLYLSQSPYFNSMFNGLWVETTQKEITIGIEDENITSAALHKVFGSLYQDEIQIEPLEAVSILASATLLQLDDLIDQSISVMKDSINIDTVLLYHEASELYGLKDIKKNTLEWLYGNTLLSIISTPARLQQMSTELLTELISSPHLVVIQTEFSLYLLLKHWIFLRENPTFRNYEMSVVSADQYFKRISGNSNVAYLSTNEGNVYQSPFRALRLKHLVVHHIDMELIEADNIIPVEWFMPIFKLQWYQMLRVDQGVDKGPTSQVSEEDFKRDCVRCGRVLLTDVQHSWRWTGFNFGFDIVIYYSRGMFNLRRFPKTDTESQTPLTPSDFITFQSHKRHLMYQISVYSLDKNGKVTSKNETSIQMVSLTENEQTRVLTLKNEMKFPIVMSANFLLTTPLRTTDEVMPAIRPSTEIYE